MESWIEDASRGEAIRSLNMSRMSQDIDPNYSHLDTLHTDDPAYPFLHLRSASFVWQTIATWNGTRTDQKLLCSHEPPRLPERHGDLPESK